MFSKFKIDQLLVFFLLSIAFLLLSFGEELVFGRKNEQAGLTNYFEIENAVNFPSQGSSNLSDTLSVLNPSLEFWYSINGGQDYFLSDDPIVLNELENPDLTTIPTSYHWRQPMQRDEGCKSLVVQLKNPNENSKTEKKIYTFFEKGISELPIIVLTLPQEDLFSEDRGIMSFGKNANYNESFYTAWWDRPANFTGRGLEWEREVFFQYFKEGNLEFEQTCGLKISGNATRGFPQKSMQIIARKMYGKEQFEFPFFGESSLKKYTSLVIRNSGNDNTKTLFADLLMHWFAKETSVLTLKGTPTVVYLNGNYWGIYNLRERIDEYFIAEIEDVKPEAVTILEGGNAELKDGLESDKKDFDKLMEELKEMDHLTLDLYNHVLGQIEEGSFIDYIFFETFYGNNDWPNNNSICYKAGDGRWKWILQDLDYGLAYLGPDNVNTNIFDKLKKSDTVIGLLFTKLMTNGSFEKHFIWRCTELANFLFKEEKINEVFGELRSQYQPEIAKHIGRWRMIDSVEEWETNCQNNFNFLIERKAIYLKQLGTL